jgi:hypothetical protein
MASVSGSIRYYFFVIIKKKKNQIINETIVLKSQEPSDPAYKETQSDDENLENVMKNIIPTISDPI